MTYEITPAELAEAIGQVTLLDVREPYEWDAGRLPNAIHIPLQQLPERMSEVSLDTEVIVYCRSGARSARAVDFLRQCGYERVKNLVGGLQRWAREVDPTVTVV
jgi:adenylyltransferase/sulfurtransferase